jgi:hypothetical protein
MRLVWRSSSSCACAAARSLFVSGRSRNVLSFVPRITKSAGPKNAGASTKRWVFWTGKAWIVDYISTDPPLDWMDRLRRGHRVWLVKEEETARVEFAYEAPEPGHRTGCMGICRRDGQLQSWFVGLNGEGIDGSQLILPLEGHLPEHPEPLPEPIVRQMLRTIHRLETRVRRLENMGAFLKPYIGEFD